MRRNDTEKHLAKSTTYTSMLISFQRMSRAVVDEGTVTIDRATLGLGPEAENA